MEAKERLYYALGELAYAVAMADGQINYEERNKLHDIVVKEIEAGNYNFDISGIIFQILQKEESFTVEEAYHVRDAKESKAINDLQEPCIIISASGMADAGRIKHHLANAIEDARNSILIIGYSEPSSLSGRLQRGDKTVNINGVPHPVNAAVHSIDFFSAHADYHELLQFLSCQEK
jgi:predicted metal-dependent RNase